MVRHAVRARLLAALALLSSVGLGMVLGVPLGERRAESRRPVGPPMTMVSEGILLDALRLPAAEERQVSAILRQGRRRSDSLMRTLLDQVVETTEQTRADLEQVLDSARRAALDSLLQSDRQLRQRRQAP